MYRAPEPLPPPPPRPDWHPGLIIVCLLVAASSAGDLWHSVRHTLAPWPKEALLALLAASNLLVIVSVIRRWPTRIIAWLFAAMALILILSAFVPAGGYTNIDF